MHPQGHFGAFYRMYSIKKKTVVPYKLTYTGVGQFIETLGF